MNESTHYIKRQQIVNHANELYDVCVGMVRIDITVQPVNRVSWDRFDMMRSRAVVTATDDDKKLSTPTWAVVWFQFIRSSCCISDETARGFFR